MADKKKESPAETPEQEFLTIREFAELAGVSRQAVYQRLKGLDSFTRQVDRGGGKPVTLISREALPIFSGEKSRPEPFNLQAGCQDKSKADNQDSGKVDTKNSQVDSQDKGETVKLIDLLERENERLREELAAQRDVIRDKDRQLSEYTSRFAELAAQAQQIAAQAQTLHAADKPRLIGAQTVTVAPEAEAEDAEPPEDPAPTEQPAAKAPEQPDAPDGGVVKPKLSFWKRLFGEY